MPDLSETNPIGLYLLTAAIHPGAIANDVDEPRITEPVQLWRCARCHATITVTTEVDSRGPHTRWHRQTT